MRIFFPKFSGKLSGIFRLKVPRYRAYPPYLRNGCKKITPKTLRYEKYFLRKLTSPAGPASPPALRNAPFKIPVSIELATQKLSWASTPNWLEEFDDREDAFALHRWGWLLMLGTDNPSEEIKKWGIEVMCDWFSKMKKKTIHCSWESYSVSERIVNCILFLYCLRDYPFKESGKLDGIEKGLIESALFLKDRLEFKGSSTNNHVLNNARSLYILGRLASSHSLADIGRRILTEETPRMITPSGFLREGSSNYHFLLLRTYLEILWAAEYTKDTPFADAVRPIVHSMLRAAWFFYVYNRANGSSSYPFFGDVSPDFPPEWLSKICTSLPALRLYNPREAMADLSTGWNALWKNDSREEVYEAQKSHNSESSLQLFRDSGWYRVTRGNLTVFWHVPMDSSEALYSHGHNDICSFVVYWKGRQVILDAGLFSYKKGPLGLYARGALAHNSFMVDGLEPYPVFRNIHPPEYNGAKARVDWEEEKDGFVFKISHTGFQRIDRRFSASREFHVENNKMSIKDTVEGSGRHKVTTLFHFADSAEIYDIFSSTQKNALKKIFSGEVKPRPLGWYFPKYGRMNPVKTLVIEAESDFPYSAEYSMHFGGR